MRVCNDKSSVIQVSKRSYSNSSCFNSQNVLIFQKLLFAFSVTPSEKDGCDRLHSEIFFDLCLLMKYKIRLVKAQVLKSDKTLMYL